MVGGRAQRLQRAIGGAIAACLLAWAGPAEAQPRITSVVPAAVSADVTVRLTGEGFGATASGNEVLFTPASGVPAQGVVTAISALDPTGTLRRITVRVPRGLPLGRAAITVRNTSTGQTAAGASVEIVALEATPSVLAPGQTRDLTVVLRGAWAFDAASTRVTLGAGITVNRVTVAEPTRLVASVTVSTSATAGARTLGIITPQMTAAITDGLRVDAAGGGNAAPLFTTTPPTTATAGVPLLYEAAATDPDGDPVSFVLGSGPEGMAVDAASGRLTWTPTAAQGGPQAVTLRARDGRGGEATQSFTVTVTVPVTLDTMSIDPASVAFTETGATRQLTVTGLFSDQSTRDLTAASTGTSYETSTPDVVTVSPDGLLTAAGAGVATITARNAGKSATAQVTVTLVSLIGLDVSPARATLRAIGATLRLTVVASYSDGTTRDVTADPATAYETGDAAVVTVDAGAVTAAGTGRSTVTARFGGRSAVADIDVVAGSTSGAGFVRGEAFDDRTGLPLGGATVTLLADGGGPLTVPLEVTADTRGRFVLPARAGSVAVRVSKAGFTSVDRLAIVGADDAATLLDARLTTTEAPRVVVSPAQGGVAANARGDVLLTVPAGALVAEAAIALTPVSNQGLAGRLPLGWSPVFAVEVGPVVAFSVPATLQVPRLDSLLSPNSPVVLARYDDTARAWRALAPATVSPDGASIVGSVEAGGQFAFLVPDVAPFEPPAPVAGELLGGVAASPLPASLTATGVVVPRAAPPGDDARAVGTVVADAGEPMPSGVVVRARVTEQFNLLDQSSVVPQPYTQDFVLYARPRLPQGGRVATTFPITPSLRFTIQQLALGTVRLDVTADEPAEGGAVVGAAGATVGDPLGALLDVPDGALGGDTFVGIAPIAASQAPIALPAGLTLLGGATVDLVGATFSRAATLSVPRPAGLASDAVVVLAEVFVDPFGGRRLRIVGRGLVGASRITAQPNAGGLALDGVSRGGDFLFVQLAEPIGLVDGTQRGAGGTTPFGGALVTSDTSPFADISTSTGRFVVAARVGTLTTVRALDTVGGDGATGELTAAVAFGVTPLALTLTLVPPTVVETAPAAGAVNVPLDTTIVVTFSEPIDPASVTGESVTVRVGTTDVAGTRVLSADRRRVTFRPDGPLAGLTTHIVTVSDGIRDAGGNALASPVTVEFRTLDPSKPPQPDPGRITALLPDEDGFVLVVGTGGTAEAGRPVTATNPRTQETVTVLALQDGSFRLQVPAIVGDEIALTFRESADREVTFLVSQFTGPDGQASIGAAGGTFANDARTATVRPRALAVAGVFQLRDAVAGALPGATGDFGYLDRFSVSVGDAQFTQLRSLTLAESQNRFPQVLTGDAPFTAAGSLVVPADILVSASVRFTAVATDATGRRATAEGATVVVGSSADDSRVEVPVDAQFPVVHLDLPRQALPNQQVAASAVAPSARIEFDLQVPSVGGTPTVFLVGPIAVGADRKLVALDQFTATTQDGATRLRSSGRTLPGVTASGDYGVAAFSTPMSFVAGRVTGPAAIVTVDNWPLAAVTTTANGRFVLPVRASATLTLRFLDAATLAELGQASVQSLAVGTRDIGTPLGTGAATMTVLAAPDSRSVADIGTPIVFTFSEPVDPASVSAANILVTDTAGRRVFGRFDRSGDGRVVTFSPLRRWKFATRYRYSVAQAVRSLSGTTLAQAFSGEFTTFAPRVVANAATGDARDVAVGGTGLAAVAGGTGLAVVDVSSPATPAVRATLPVAGGARGVALRESPLVDRLGATRSGPLAVVAAGNASGTGRAEVVSLENVTAPSLVGQAQLTTAPGAAAPANVPAAAGTPASVALTADGRALVAVEGVGVSSLALSAAVPADSANPGGALGPRYPATGAESFVQAVSLGERIAAVGPAGLVVLDAATLTRTGGAAIQNAPAGVSGAAGFLFDRNGDGTFDESDRFDLAVVAGGIDGTVQFFRVPAFGDPQLISVVRVDGAVTTGVTVDADERLAYVGLGQGGLALVDLEGGASVQPIDLDRDGVDDRLLGRVDTPGTASRVARTRAVALVADGPQGLAVVQVQPARTRFLTLRRDPLASRPGDEVDVPEGGFAVNSDDAVLVSLDASVPPQGSLRLVVEERPDQAGAPLRVGFADGTTVATLTAGTNQLTLPLAQVETGGASLVVLRVVDESGRAVASRSFRLADAVADAPGVTALQVVPFRIELNDARVAQAVSVGALLADGRSVNVTEPWTGTTYQIGDPRIAGVTPDGQVYRLAGGTTTLSITHRGLTVTAPVVVTSAGAFDTLVVDRTHMTLSIAGEAQAPRVRARLTDGTFLDLGGVGAVVTSSNTAVVTVDAQRRLVAAGDGTATVTVRVGATSVEIPVAVELRQPATVTALDLQPFAAAARTDEGSIDARAQITGTGSLDGLVVEFERPGAPTVRARSDRDGRAFGRLTGLTAPGNVTVTARVIDPSTGTARSDAETLTVEAAGADAEPNDSPANAPALAVGRAAITGTLGNGDTRDTFAAASRVPGTLTMRVALSGGVNPAVVRLLRLAADGSVLQAQPATGTVTEFPVAVGAGDAYLAVETLDGSAVTYAVELRFEQGPLTIASVTPLAGGPGTSVTITGSGFSTDPGDVRVLFGGVMGRVTSASPTQVTALVPANAISGPVTVIATARRATGPAFDAGQAGPLPRPTWRAGDAADVRFDPVTEQRVDVTRLGVTADPVTTRAQVEALVAPFGGVIAGTNPVLNYYLLEFPANGTLSGLAAIARTLSASPLLRLVRKEGFSEIGSIAIDARSPNNAASAFNLPYLGVAFAQAGIFDAIDAIRQTPPFVDYGATFQPVKVGIVDTGFSPFDQAEYVSGGINVVTLFRANAQGVFVQSPINLSSDPSPSGHGTKVTSIIAALNTGSPGSGVFGGLFAPGEAQFETIVYGLDDYSDSQITNALTDLAERGDIDVLNLSFGKDWPGPSPELEADKAFYGDLFALFGGRTLIVTSAGNAGVQAEFHTPSILESTLPYVMSIAAVAVRNLDGSGEGSDARAIFNGALGKSTSAYCLAGVEVGGSNCGPGITMAAPGEDVLVYGKTASGWELGAGTSYASPMVAAVAALMQAIRPPGAALSPDVLRSLLVDSGTDITARFSSAGQPMRRLNALNAVRVILDASAPQMIYVSDQQAGTAEPFGRVIGIDVDPLTGKRPTPPNPDVVIPLTFTAQGQTFQGTKPTAMIASPLGDRLFVVVNGGTSLGDGLLVINTRSNRAVDFIAFSGAPFPVPAPAPGAPAPPLPAPVKAPTLKPALAFSKDGRLLYAGIGTALIVVNVVDGRVVTSASDLPAEYTALAPLVGPSAIAERLADVRAQVQAGIQTSAGARAGASISGLALSPDGTMLYGAVSTGGGGGLQPGGVFAVDVNLYRDAIAEAPGLQTDLSSYLALKTAAVEPMVGAGGFLGGDEPSGIAVSGDGKHVYLANGGLNLFEAIPPSELDLSKYYLLVAGPALGALAGGGTVLGLSSALAAAAATGTALYNDLLLDMREIANSGQTLISAPGVTGVFSPDGSPQLPQSWVFTSDVNFGWAPNPSNGGLIVNQFRFNSVFAKRPFGIAMRPDGRRALLPLFQTGNLAVLDLDAQSGFRTRPGPPAPKPDFAQLPATMFHGVVGVTESIDLDNHLWPSRGAFFSNASGTFMPSPDENRLYTWAAEYAQNGRWAAVVHTGTGSPRTVSAVVPDLTFDRTTRFRLEKLGYTFADGVLTATSPGTQPQTIASGDTLTFVRGGGALSVVDDALLTATFTARKNAMVAASNGTTRPFLATNPVCAFPATFTCGGDDAAGTEDSYAPAGGSVRYHRPRGVAVQPFVAIESPRFGDRVGASTPIGVAWRDARIRDFTIRVLDLDQVDDAGQPTPVGTRAGSLSQLQVQARSLSAIFGVLFDEGQVPVVGRRYRVEVALSINVPAVEELSRTSIDVVFDQQPDVVVPADTLDLTPTLIPAILVPTPEGNPIQLEVTLDPADGDPVDVTASPETTYLWVGGTSNPLIQLGLDLSGADLNKIANDIKDKLSEALEVPLPFAIGEVTVDGQGRLRIIKPGLQVVQAVHRRNGQFIFAAPSVVIAGVELSGIDLEPDTLANTVAGLTGGDKLYEKIAKKFGKKQNVPMVLVPEDPGLFSLFSNTGNIELEEVEFTYLGAGKITLNQLIGYLEPLIKRQIKKALGTSYTPQQWLLKEAGARLAAKAAVKLLQKGAAQATLDFVELKSANENVATVDNSVNVLTLDFFKGEVTAQAPGLTAVTGVLDLGRFGKGQDFVPIYVLPELTEVRPDPINLVLCDDDDLGVKVRTLAVMKFAETVTFDADLVNVEIETDADKRFQKLVGWLLPKFLPVGTPFDEEFTIGDFKFGMRGIFDVDEEEGAVQYKDFELVFTVPNVPGVVNTYTFQDDVPPDGIPPFVSNVARVRSTQAFTQRVAAVGPGRTVNQVFVSIPVLGTKQGVGSVTVTELCQTPSFTKENLTGVTEIIGVPPDLTYVISVYNPTDFPLENVQVRDIATYFREPRTGTGDDEIEVVQVQTIDEVPPNSRIDVPFLVQTFGYTRIENRGEVSGGQGGDIPPVDPCQIAPCVSDDEVTGGQDPPEPPPAEPDFCQDNPTDPLCVCFVPNPPAECVVRPEPVIVKRNLKLVKEVVSPPDVNGQPSPVLAGTQVRYRIGVINEGPEPVPGVVLTDITVLRGPEGGSAQPIERRQDFLIGTLQPGQGAQREVVFPDQGVVPMRAGYGGGLLFNQVTANVDDTDPAEVTNPVIESDVVITKRLVDPAGDALATLVRGSLARYEITAENTGTAPSQPLTLTDTAYVIGQGTPFAYERAFEVGVLQPGAVETRVVEFTVPTRAELSPPPCVPSPTAGCPIYLVGTSHLQNDVFGPDGLYAGTTHQVVNPELDVKVRLVAPGGSAIAAGATATFEVTVTNVSAHTARDVRVNVTTQLANLVRTSGGQQLRIIGGGEAIALGAIAPGGVRSAQFTVQVPADGDGFDIQRLDTRSRVNYRQKLAATTSHAVVDAAVVVSPVLGSAGANALVVTGRPPVLVTGDALSYSVEVKNTTKAALFNVPVTHVVTLEVRDASGAVASTPVTTATTTIPTLDAEASVTLTFTATVPTGANGGLLVSTLAAPGAGDVRLEHGVIEPGPAGLLVTEMVVDPKQDWSDSGPSNVAGDDPFDETPGDGAVDAGDIWVEITAPSVATANWSVVLVDANGDQFSRPFGAPVSGQRVKVLSGFGSPVLPIARVDVRDGTGATQRSYDVAAIADELGPATGPANESLTWVLDALPSAVLQQFARRPATINQLLPF